MLRKFKKFKKFREYVSFEFENKFSVLATIITLILCVIVKFYSNYYCYENVINDFCVAIIGAYIGSLALIFSGIVFLADLLTNRFDKTLIKYSEDPDAPERLYISYLFLAFNILCMIFATILVLVFSNSTLRKPPVIVFVIILFLYLYLTFFVLAYFVALIRNTVDLLMSERNSKSVKTLYERANEIRIDMILQYMFRNSSKEEAEKIWKKYIEDYVKLGDDSEALKEELMDYFSKYYSDEEQSE